MQNRSLAADYVRAEARVQALDVLFAARSWADVVGESQETLASVSGRMMASLMHFRAVDVSIVFRQDARRSSGVNEGFGWLIRGEIAVCRRGASRSGLDDSRQPANP